MAPSHFLGNEYYSVRGHLVSRSFHTPMGAGSLLGSAAMVFKREANETVFFLEMAGCKVVVPDGPPLGFIRSM